MCVRVDGWIGRKAEGGKFQHRVQDKGFTVSWYLSFLSYILSTGNLGSSRYGCLQGARNSAFTIWFMVLALSWFY